MSKDQEQEALKLIDEHGDRAAQVAWNKSAEFVKGEENREKFDFWYGVAQELQELK